MRSFCRFIITSLIFLSSANALAGFVELNTFYFTDSMTTATSASNNRTFLEFAAGFKVDKKGKYMVGWNYGSYAATDAAGTTSTYSSTQMGPRLLIQLDKSENWSLGISYNLVTKATFNPGTAETVWKGTGTKLDVGYNFDISESFQLGLRLNYANGAYNEQIDGGTALSAVSYSRTFIYPSVYTIYRF